MRKGQTVYTVNNQTNKVDSWTCDGVLPTKDGLLVCLMNGKTYCFLPVRCVFESELKAKEIAELQQN